MSAVCETQVIVVRAPAVEVELGCGGAPLIGADETRRGRARPGARRRHAHRQALRRGGARPRAALHQGRRRHPDLQRRRARRSRAPSRSPRPTEGRSPTDPGSTRSSDTRVMRRLGLRRSTGSRRPVRRGTDEQRTRGREDPGGGGVDVRAGRRRGAGRLGRRRHQGRAPGHGRPPARARSRWG